VGPPKKKTGTMTYTPIKSINVTSTIHGSVEKRAKREDYNDDQVGF
jgi:hypothetical protein